MNRFTKVGIFDCPGKVKIGDTVEFVYNCYSVDDIRYNDRAVGKVKYINSMHILVELPVGFKQIGDIKGWFGKEQMNSTPVLLTANRLYWWVATFRLLTKSLEIE